MLYLGNDKNGFIMQCNARQMTKTDFTVEVLRQKRTLLWNEQERKTDFIMECTATKMDFVMACRATKTDFYYGMVVMECTATKTDFYYGMYSDPNGLLLWNV